MTKRKISPLYPNIFVSPLKLKEMQKFCPEYRSFPGYFEVRFAEHVINLITAVLHNLPGCFKYSRHFSKTPGSLIDKNLAVRMLNTWSKSEFQQLLQTCLMVDVLLVMKELQKNLQKGRLILPDVLTLKQNALRKLKLMLHGPYPGGQEEKFPLHQKNVQDNTNNEENDRKRRKISHSLVITGTRSWTE